MNLSDITDRFKFPREPKRALESDISSVASKRLRTGPHNSPTNSETISEAAGTSIFEAAFPCIDDDARDDLRTLGSVRSGRPRTSSTHSLRTSERIDSLIKTVAECSFTEEDLSNPGTVLHLPYPSTVRKPPMCFGTHVRNGVRYFRYMGREVVRDLLEMARNFTDGKTDVGTYYLSGPPGSGKSHILAALACLLLQQGGTILYIPDCANLWKDPIQLFKEILSFTYYDRQEDIQGIRDMTGLSNFVLSLSQTPTAVTCIVDNIHVLFEASGDVNAKLEVSSLIRMFSTNHFTIYGSTTCQVEESDAKESVTIVMGGLSEREMNQWWKHFKTESPSFGSLKEKKEVEYETGRLPSLLRQLRGFAGAHYKSIRAKFMSSQVFMDLRGSVSERARAILKEVDGNSVDRPVFISHLEACIRNTSIDCPISTAFFDRRYFYFVRGVGFCSCGIVRDAITKVLLSYQPASMDGQKWAKAILNVSMTNPSLKGFLVEMVCLSHISTRGLKTVDVELDAMSMSQFSAIPSWEKMSDAEAELDRDGIWRQLYIPLAYNYEAIDGFIAMLNKKSKSLELFAIQITVSRKHKDSEKQFFAKWWSPYYDSIPDKFKKQYTVSIDFIWIHKGVYVTDEPKSITMPSKVKEGPKTYRQFKVPLETINPEFEKL